MGLEAARAELRRARVARAPRCCGAHAAWDALLGRPPILARSWELQAHPARRWQNLPVCGVRHHANSRFNLPRRLLRLLKFNATALVLGRRWWVRAVKEARESAWQRAPDPAEERWFREEAEMRRTYWDPWLDGDPSPEIDSPQLDR